MGTTLDDLPPWRLLYALLHTATMGYNIRSWVKGLGQYQCQINDG